MKVRMMYVMVALLLMGSPIALFAQNKDDKGNKQRPTPEEITKIQTNQLLGVLMLDDATAAKFTTVYGKYLNELRECRLKKHPAKKDGKKDAEVEGRKKSERHSMTDAEIATMFKNDFAKSRQVLDIREKYYKEFSKILSQKQILKVYQQEKKSTHKFKKNFDRRKGQGKHQRTRMSAPTRTRG